MTTRAATSRTLTLTPGELGALVIAADYYRETLDECSVHPDDAHGDETECEGWGPRDLAELDAAIGTLYREA